MDVYLNKLVQLLKSRKFWAAIAGLVVAIFGERAGLTADQIAAAVATVITYIMGTALEDGLSRSRNR